MADWIYTGDVNPEYGGVWFDLEPYERGWGYFNAVRVEDLDGACGFRGAVLIERLSIHVPDQRSRIQDALECCGMTEDDIEGNLVELAYALMMYGCTDIEQPTETLQLDADGPMEFDGWKADRKQPKGDLRGYIEAKWLD